MGDCPRKPANRMKLIRQQNDPTNPNTLGATFVQMLTKENVPGNETEPEIIKENVNYSNAGNMEENENNMENMDTQNATEIENSQEPESSADDEDPKIESITDKVLNEGTEADTANQNPPDIIESSQTILTDAFKLPPVKKKKNQNKRRKKCEGTSSSEEEKKIAKIVTRRRETTEELAAGDIKEKNEEANIEKLASAVSIHVCNNITTNSGQQVGPPSKKEQFLK
ncbi:hypothetical protein HHI36_016824 [Cryptolaemus montrouzieri]|uniref:Uncharacterized protein n=1 Tax=Cryptolaemus montrouzieri TaxID=559131 RepID=A0ABD2NKP3_9CUCU